MSVTSDLLERSDAAFHILEDYVAVRDNKKLYFGSDGDAWVQYNTTLNKLEFGGVGVTFSAGDSALYQDFSEITTPASPAADVLRLFATDVGGITTLRTVDSAGVVSDIGTGTVINAAKYPGATPAIKINAAIVAATTGQTVDARSLSGANATTILLNKGIMLQINNSLTWSVTPCIHIPLIAGAGAGGTVGPIIEGSGPGATRIVPMTGGIGVRVESHDVTLRDFGIEFAGLDDANKAIYAGNLSTGCLRPYFTNLDLFGGGTYQTGKGEGILYEESFPGSLVKCHIHGFETGVRTKSETNAQMMTQNRIYDNFNGIISDTGTGDIRLFYNTIEGNSHYGLWMKAGFTLISEGNHYEQTLNEFGAWAASNIYIEGITSNFFRSYSSDGDSFGTQAISIGYDIFIGDGTGQFLYNNSPYSCEVHVGTGQPPISFGPLGIGVGAARTTGKNFKLGGTPGNTTGITLSGSSGLGLSFPSWDSVIFAKEFVDTGAVNKVYTSFNVTANAPTNSGMQLTGTSLSVSTDVHSPANYTNVVVSAITQTNHYGSGVASNLWGGYVHVTSVLAASEWSAISSYSIGNLALHGGHTYESKTIGNLNHEPPDGTYWTDLGAPGNVTNMVANYVRVSHNTPATVAAATPIFIAPVINSGGGFITDYTALSIADTSDRTGIANYYAVRTFGGTVEFIVKTNELFQVFANDPNAFKVDGTTGTVGMGAAPIASAKVFINSVWTDVGTAENGLVLNTQFGPTGTRTVASDGLSMTTFTTSANAQNFTQVFRGLHQSTEHRGTGIMSDFRAAAIQAVNSSTGRMTVMVGEHIGLSNSTTGIIDNGWGIFLAAPENPSGTFTTYEGIRITAPTSGTFTNYRGLYLTEPTATVGGINNTVQTDGGNVVFNESGGAWGFRAETDNVVAAFVIDGVNDGIAFGAITNSTSWVNVTQPAATSGVKRGLHVIAGAHTGLTATAEVNDVYFDLSRSVNWASGAIATQRAFLIDAPTLSVTAGVSQVISDAATFAVTGAPVAAGDGTVITRSMALWVQAGWARFDGNVTLGGGGSSIGFYGAAPTAKGSTFTQTYATTATTLVDGSNDLVNGTGVAAVDQTMEDVTSIGVADPVKVNRNFAEVVAEYNKLRASELSTKQVLNALLDYLQLRGDIG